MVIRMCLIVAAAIAGGKISLDLARAGDLAKAAKAVRIGGLAAGACAVSILFMFLGWPFKTESVIRQKTVPDQQTESVPATTRHILFIPVPWGGAPEHSVTHESERTEHYRDTLSEFSFARLVAMGLIGWIAFFLEMCLIRFVWRWRG